MGILEIVVAINSGLIIWLIFTAYRSRDCHKSAGEVIDELVKIVTKNKEG